MTGQYKKINKNICDLFCEMNEQFQYSTTATFPMAPNEKWWNAGLISLPDFNEVHAFFQLLGDKEKAIHIIADKSKSSQEEVSLQARLIHMDGIRDLRSYFTLNPHEPENIQEGFSTINAYIESKLPIFNGGINMGYDAKRLSEEIQVRIPPRIRQIDNQ